MPEPGRRSGGPGARAWTWPRPAAARPRRSALQQRGDAGEERGVRWRPPGRRCCGRRRWSRPSARRSARAPAVPPRTVARPAAAAPVARSRGPPPATSAAARCSVIRAAESTRVPSRSSRTVRRAGPGPAGRGELCVDTGAIVRGAGTPPVVVGARNPVLAARRTVRCGSPSPVTARTLMQVADRSGAAGGGGLRGHDRGARPAGRAPAPGDRPVHRPRQHHPRPGRRPDRARPGGRGPAGDPAEPGRRGRPGVELAAARAGRCCGPAWHGSSPWRSPALR